MVRLRSPAQNVQESRRRALLTPSPGPQAEALRSQFHNAGAGAGIACRPSQDHALGLGACEAGPHPLHTQRALELSEGADERVEQLAHGGVVSMCCVSLMKSTPRR
jgi:hypothetical protein